MPATGAGASEAESAHAGETADWHQLLLAGSCVFSMTFTGIGGQVPIFSCFPISLEHPLLKEPYTEQQAKLKWSAESWGQYHKAK